MASVQETTLLKKLNIQRRARATTTSKEGGFIGIGEKNVERRSDDANAAIAELAATGDSLGTDFAGMLKKLQEFNKRKKVGAGVRQQTGSALVSGAGSETSALTSIL